MNPYFVAPLATFILSIYMANYVYYRAPDSPQNRVFTLVCVFLAYWTFTLMQMTIAHDVDTAMGWVLLESFWTVPVAASLHYVLIFTGTPEATRKRFLPIHYAIAVAFPLIVVTTGLVEGTPESVAWGWEPVSAGTGFAEGFFLLATLWAAAIAATNLILCYRSFRVETDERRRGQARTIAIAYAIPFFLGIFVELVMQGAGIFLPNMVPLGILACLLIIFRTILRYDLMAITPEKAARSITSTMSDALFIVDGEGAIRSTNEAAGRMLGYLQEEMVGKHIREVMVDGRAGEDLWRRVFVNGNEVTGKDAVELDVSPKTGRPVPLSVAVSILKDPMQSVLGGVVLARDISRHRDHEETLQRAVHDREVLLRELNHRVKNNLQLVSSIMDLEIMDDDSGSTERLENVQSIIQSLDQIQTRIFLDGGSGTEDVKSFIKDVVVGVLNVGSRWRTEIVPSVTGDSFPLDSDRVIPLGLITNEILFNSIKHAFPDRKTGSISIDIRLSDGTITMMFRDDGVGLPEDMVARKGSMGMKLISSLVEQLGGELETRNEDGAVFTLTFSC